MTFGAWVRAERERRSLSQAELAARLEIAQPYLSRIEQDKQRNPGSKVFGALAREFGITTDEVYAAAGLGPVPTLPDDLTTLLSEAQAVGVPRRLVEQYRRAYPDMPQTEQQGVLEDLRDIIRQYRAAQVEAGQRPAPQPPPRQASAARIEPTMEARTAPVQTSAQDSPMLLRRESASGC